MLDFLPREMGQESCHARGRRGSRSRTRLGGGVWSVVGVLRAARGPCPRRRSRGGVPRGRCVGWWSVSPGQRAARVRGARSRGRGAAWKVCGGWWLFVMAVAAVGR
jgi:hypothetical protein